MLHRHRLGQGLPISTIIIAAIGLIVLVIIIMIVQQRTTLFGKGLGEASEQTCPGTWEPIGTDCDIVYGKFTEQNEHPGEVCCRETT